jgi:hypothetical protein
MIDPPPGFQSYSLVTPLRGVPLLKVEPAPLEPPEVLLLRPDGTFEFTSAADSAQRVERYIGTLPQAEERKAPGRPPAGPGGGPPTGGADVFGAPGQQPRQ